MQKTDYSKIAATYKNRYVKSYLPGIEKEIINIIQVNDYKTILEAGCGTGRWINSLDQLKHNVFGLDYSIDMLKIPREEFPALKLINADADFIPLKNNYFDLIFCVNAIHHFPDKETFIHESRRVLSQNGTLAIFGVDPHVDREWYVYDYFDSVYENDLKRFPSSSELKSMLFRNGFEHIEMKVTEKVYHKYKGEEVFNDPFLDKLQNSQLANLTDKQYQEGIDKIKKQIQEDSETTFITNVIFYLISGTKK